MINKALSNIYYSRRHCVYCNILNTIYKYYYKGKNYNTQGVINISYVDLYSIANINNTEARLIKYSSYYKDKKIKGMHYVNFDKSTNTLSISNPNHRTHHLATSFVVAIRDLSKVNSARKKAYELKKFLDFLSIWEIDLLECDLLVLILSFIDYLKCIAPSPAPKFTNAALFYSSLESIPLNRVAATSGRVISITPNNLLQQKNKKWEDLEPQSIYDIVATSIQYITYLSEKASTYKTLPLNQLPHKKAKSRSMLAGTLSPLRVETVDIEYLLAQSGIKLTHRSSKIRANHLLVMTLNEVNQLINIIHPSDYQNKLLFITLKLFGMRAGEAADLLVDTHNLSKNFLFLDDRQALEDLKQNISGDLEYNKILKQWVFHISEPSTDRYDMQAKTGLRSIPLVYSEKEFEQALIYGIKERFILINYLAPKDRHDYLFVSKRNGEKGSNITGSTINNRFETLAKKLYEQSHIDLRKYSPHSLRHFYATYLIREKGYRIDDVSKWLGHSSVEMTRSTYFHYLPSQTRNINVSKDISNTFKKEFNKLDN